MDLGSPGPAAGPLWRLISGIRLASPSGTVITGPSAQCLLVYRVSTMAVYLVGTLLSLTGTATPPPPKIDSPPYCRIFRGMAVSVSGHGWL